MMNGDHVQNRKIEKKEKKLFTKQTCNLPQHHHRDNTQRTQRHAGSHVNTQIVRQQCKQAQKQTLFSIEFIIVNEWFGFSLLKVDSHQSLCSLQKRKEKECQQAMCWLWKYVQIHPLSIDCTVISPVTAQQIWFQNNFIFHLKII